MKTTVTSTIFLISLLVLGASCAPNQRILESANENRAASEQPIAMNTNAASRVSSFEQDLNAMRTADFKFIVVFRRKDGRAFDAADKELLRITAAQANRRALSDEGKAVIIGSNFPFVTGAFKPLEEGFRMENYSKPDSGPMFSDAVPNK